MPHVGRMSVVCSGRAAGVRGTSVIASVEPQDPECDAAGSTTLTHP
eukprot:CAMPEP_0202845300 /NCGR_PEP_ID=MMETSP1389-20130828/69747_1 /ASSEMBLY_ACC=CAM_ASM_000865 /TAXON_ID=302021 /ORGANISM="Rhodomonas sp., Strain CCMP768" /LENGTH=45 /DNA_ID= /DNA_START= /DNA_END= /DNA_ORIENTATION=